jgi:hypothetical protein
VRTRFPGEILVFHNSPQPLYKVARAGVREAAMEVPESALNGDFAAFAQQARVAAALQIDPAGFDKILYIDPDSIVLRRIGHLLGGDWELAAVAEPGTRIQDEPYGARLTAKERSDLECEGLNSGTWAVPAPKLAEFIAHWRAALARSDGAPTPYEDQVCFNRVALDWGGRVHRWPRGEIALPLCNPHFASYDVYARAAIVHAASPRGAAHKLRFLFSLFAGTFLYDPQLALFNIMEM